MIKFIYFLFFLPFFRVFVSSRGGAWPRGASAHHVLCIWRTRFCPKKKALGIKMLFELVTIVSWAACFLIESSPCWKFNQTIVCCDLFDNSQASIKDSIVRIINELLAFSELKLKKKYLRRFFRFCRHKTLYFTSSSFSFFFFVATERSLWIKKKKEQKRTSYARAHITQCLAGNRNVPRQRLSLDILCNWSPMSVQLDVNNSEHFYLFSNYR